MAHDNDTHTPQTAPSTHSRLRQWLAAIRSALERAEKRITENFRVPPGGG